MENNILYIMRGVPGSGKSYRALQLVGCKDNIFSADKWFSPTENPDEYKKNWKAEKLFAAHSWCQTSLGKAMEKGITPLAVDNTNIKPRDIKPYIALAEKHKYIPIIEESQSPWWLEIRQLMKDDKKEDIAQWAKKLAEGFDYNGVVIKNVHGVPEETILRMLTSFQPYEITNVIAS
jgi:NEDD4-binding protein 2